MPDPNACEIAHAEAVIRFAKGMLEDATASGADLDKTVFFRHLSHRAEVLAHLSRNLDDVTRDVVGAIRS